MSGTAVRALVLTGCAALVALPSVAGGSLQETDFLSRVRRLTYEGRRAGEGYFSADGTKIVLQSEREPGNPFYQVYVLDLESGESSRVSPGIGKTTCAFINPDSGDILYASTHHDPTSIRQQEEELAFRASGEERRYAWDYDPEMEIYVALADRGRSRRLTTSRGYDAEGSYSPDGEWIVFTSNRQAYDRELSDEEQRLLGMDPAYFADLYLMRADGSELRQLTDVPGYDGGPFFFPDGSRIIWRRFEESGLRADVYSMNPDGSDVKRLTDFGALSWAPYVHASQQYVLFASNKLGFANFEVYMVDIAGEKEPVRITYADGFDGLPVPSPDGSMLAWTSERHGEKGGQIYMAQWNHDKALEALGAAAPRTNHSEVDDDRGGPRNSDRLLRWDPDQEEGVWNATEETELSC